MKYGVYSLLWVPNITKKDLTILERAKSMGFDGIEIPLSDDFVNSGLLMDLKAENKNVGIKLIFSTGLDVNHNIISSEEKIRERGLDFLKKRIEIVHDFGGDIISGVLYAPWGYFTGKPKTKSEWEYCKEGLWKAAEFAKDAQVYIAIEPVNRFESYFLNTAAEAKQLINEIGHSFIKIHLDTFQMNIEENSMYEAITTAGELLYYFHCCESHRGIPGTGHVEWDEVFKAFKEVGYNNWLTIESFTPEIMGYDFGKQVSIWRKIAEPDEIAKKGLDFLKSMELKFYKAENL